MRLQLTSRWQLEYRDVLRCLCPSDLWLSGSMPRSSRICSEFVRCPSPLPREWGSIPWPRLAAVEEAAAPRLQGGTVKRLAQESTLSGTGPKASRTAVGSRWEMAAPGMGFTAPHRWRGTAWRPSVTCLTDGSSEVAAQAMNLGGGPRPPAEQCPVREHAAILRATAPAPRILGRVATDVRILWMTRCRSRRTCTGERR